ncbi:hypothetical protein HAX54_041732 [Datura stramonium]|uniref:Uncharacterized protein n=1 Tax=Datura stramonium TaxID=4076 RepID=A0ABS8VZZ0_DATST|nr:hypothetical protein [Datura stramonium]
MKRNLPIHDITVELEDDEEIEWTNLTSARRKSKAPSLPRGFEVTTRKHLSSDTSIRRATNEIVTSQRDTNEIVSNPAPINHKTTNSEMGGANRERTWAGMVTGNKLAAEGMSLTYFQLVIKEGEIVVHLLQEDIEAKNQK